MLQKYFIAIVPPDPILSEIEDIKTNIFENYGTKGALRSPPHITLHMPFSFEEGKENKLIATLESFHFGNSFRVSLNNFNCFEPRVVYIHVNEQTLLFQLQKELVQHVKSNLQLFNQSDSMRGFHPHITIAFRDLKKQMFYKVWNDYQTKIFQNEFSCSSFSLLKHQKDHWTVLKTFPLNNRT